MKFIDEATIIVQSGDGGRGCVSFRREKFIPRGGPDGGDGGDGGDVWLVADHNVSSLLAFRDHPHRRAADGVHGKGKDMHGRRGESLDITVPMGTVVFDMYSGDDVDLDGIPDWYEHLFAASDVLGAAKETWLVATDDLELGMIEL